MHQFVWARALCGTRIGCCATVDRSGAIRKIHVRKILMDQGVAHACAMMDFMIRGHLTRPRGPFRAQGSALTRNVARSHGSKNLLQRGILYRHEKILLRHGRFNIAGKFGNLERGNISPGTDRLEVDLQDLSGCLWRLVH